ncbi:MAG: hypothetical protein IBX64_01170 [Actinobacteria bacterium]|nr:hypothetical protein [Actinomycetota bacterium]
MQSKVAITILSMIVGFVLIITAGYYRESTMKKEAPNFMVSLNSAAEEAAESWPLTVDLSDLGFTKKVLRPWTIHVRANSITNEGNEPVQLKFSLANNSLPVTWDSRQLAWDKNAKTVARPFLPGESMKYPLSIYFHIPQKYRQQAIIYNGGLEISDVNTGRILAYVPIKLTNSKISNSKTSNSEMSTEGHGEGVCDR